MKDDIDYWAEAISEAAGSCGLSITNEQLNTLAETVSVSHECYGMAFYTPPSTDRIHDIEREWKQKYDKLNAEFNRYRGNAETAVKRALNQHHDASVGIGEGGEVTRYGGRTERIQ